MTVQPPQREPLAESTRTGTPCRIRRACPATVSGGWERAPGRLRGPGGRLELSRGSEGWERKFGRGPGTPTGTAERAACLPRNGEQLSYLFVIPPATLPPEAERPTPPREGARTGQGEPDPDARTARPPSLPAGLETPGSDTPPRRSPRHRLTREAEKSRTPPERAGGGPGG